MLAHTGNAVEGQKAQNNLQLAVIIITLALAERSIALQRRHVPFLDLQHFRHHIQRKHAAHNYQHRLRILPQDFRRTFAQPVEKMLPVLRAHRPVAQLLHCSQQAVKITAAVQPVQRFLVLPLLRVPLSQATEVHLLLSLRQQAEGMARCLLQHMVTPQSAVGQPDNKGIAFQQSAYRFSAACAVGKGHLLRSEFLRLPHKQQQTLLLRRQRPQQYIGYHLINAACIKAKALIPVVIQKVKIGNGKPALAGLMQSIQLLRCKLQAASAAVFRQLVTLQRQVMLIKAKDLTSQLQQTAAVKNMPSAYQQQVQISKACLAQSKEKINRLAALQQMQIIYKPIDRLLRQQLTEQLQHQRFGIGIGRQRLLQQRSAQLRTLPAVAHSLPEGLGTGAVNTLAQYLFAAALLLLQKVLHCQCFAVAHGSNNQRCSRCLQLCQKLFYSLGII